MIVSVESEYLSGKFCMDKKVKNLTIMNEGEMVETEDFRTKKPVTKLQFNVVLPDGTEKKWRPNQKSKGSLIKLFGEDSKAWVGKKLKLMLVPYEDTYSIQVDEIETPELNAKGKGSTLL